jgi:hypothetical protein
MVDVAAAGTMITTKTISAEGPTLHAQAAYPVQGLLRNCQFAILQPTQMHIRAARLPSFRQEITGINGAIWRNNQGIFPNKAKAAPARV